MAEKGVARVTDRVEGWCKDHYETSTDADGNSTTTQVDRWFIGYWQHGSSDVDADGLKIIRIGDTSVADCGHTFTAVGDSKVSDEDGKGIHRVGDGVVIGSGGGTGTTVTGSPNVFSL